MQKYRNKKVVIDDITFDSQKEYQRYLILRDKMQAGEISQLEIHPVFELQAAFRDFKTKEKVNAIKYIADFCYIDQHGKKIVEDVKAFDQKKGKFRVTPDGAIKLKMFRFIYGITHFLKLV